jgi:hypothetical protein
MDFYGKSLSPPFLVDNGVHRADGLIVPPDITGFEKGAMFVSELVVIQNAVQKTIEGWLIHREGRGGEVPATALMNRPTHVSLLSRRAPWVARILLLEPNDPEPGHDIAS